MTTSPGTTQSPPAAELLVGFKLQPFNNGLSWHSKEVATAMFLATARGDPNKTPTMITAKIAESLEAMLNMVFIPLVDEQAVKTRTVCATFAEKHSKHSDSDHAQNHRSLASFRRPQWWSFLSGLNVRST